MKHKKQNQDIVEESEQDNGINIQLNEQDKEKGNLKKFNLSKKFVKKLKAHNIEFLYPIQRESYTKIYEQNNCLIQSSNKTGKTLAYIIPIVELLQNDETVELVSGRTPRVLVLAPTRDATKQISDNCQPIVNDLAVVTIHSSKKKSDDQLTSIQNGCDILVATPDRLKEFIDNETIDLSQIKHIILDEIDLTSDDVKKVLKHALTSDEETKKQLIIVSETIPDSIRKLTKKYLTTDFVTINVNEENKQETSAADDDDDDEDSEEPVIKSSAKKSNVAEDGNRSLLTKQENYTTYQLTAAEEIKSVGFVFSILRRCFGDDFDAKGAVSQIAFTKDYQSAVFDLPSEYDEQLQGYWKDSAKLQMGPITELPELDESSMNDNKSFSRGNNRSTGGFGNRNTGRSGGGGGGGGGCFNCGKDGHKSFECTEPRKAGGGGGRSGGGERSNACFNCGKDGHRSFECTEPKKAGGGRGGRSGGGERSNACFNCGKDGHRSFECTEPKKAGGREQSNACFNCGKDGHKSFDCPEPKKGRPSFGGGGRGGARGGGPKRSFGGYQENGHNSGETANKKIKFDDDDE